MIAGPATGNRDAITARVFPAAVTRARDTTIADVALPHIQGGVSSSTDQIDRMLTS